MTQKDKILELISRKKGATNIILNKIAFRYSARLSDLRKEGHKILSLPVPKTGGQVWCYKLIK